MIYNDQPLDWFNISIDEYLQLQDILLDSEDLEKEDLVLQEIQVLYNQNPYNMSMPQFKKCLDGLKFLAKPIPKMKVKDKYILNGNQYTLHKQLNEFKVAQYLDYEQIMKDNKGVEAYPEFIALFLTPSSLEKNANYGDGYDVGTVIADIRKYMSIADAMAIAAFFLNLSKAYIVRFLLSSRRMMKKNTQDKTTRKKLMQKTRKMIQMVIRGA